MTETARSQNEDDENRSAEVLPGFSFKPTSGLRVDWERFGSYLKDSDLTDDQKREFIETYWNLVVAFVDLGFGIHPVQLATKPSCGQNPEKREQRPQQPSDPVDWTDPNIGRALVDAFEGANAAPLVKGIKQSGRTTRKETL